MDLSLSTAMMGLGILYFAYKVAVGPFRQFSVLMFLNYFVWGAWYVTMGTYLGTTLKFSGPEIGTAYSMLSVAAMISPFFVGMIADRFFATQKVLGVLHLLGAVLLYALTRVSTPLAFTPLILAYTLCYMPTIALSNSICFRRMANPGQEFPPIRVLGTIGWIVVGGLLSYLNIEASADQFLLAGGVSLVTGIYCFFLPDTPPALKGNPGSVRDILGLDALKLMKNTSFAVMVVSSVLICIPLAFYYGFANPFLNELRMEDAAGKMTLGQASELFFMLVMPFFFVRLGFKKMIVLGMIAWVLRYVLFAFGNTGSLEWMLYAGIILHGICYDFFFVTGQIFVDRRAPEHLRSSAQGMITFATYGLGMFIGSQVAGQIVGAYTLDQGTHGWQSIWLVPAVASAVVLVIFAVLFREKDTPKEELKAKAA